MHVDIAPRICEFLAINDAWLFPGSAVEVANSSYACIGFFAPRVQNYMKADGERMDGHIDGVCS